MSALHIAVARGLHVIVEILCLNNSTEIDVESELYGTPLQMASRNNSPKMVQQLLLNGADPTLQTTKGEKARDLTTSSRCRLLFDLYDHTEVFTN